MWHCGLFTHVFLLWAAGSLLACAAAPGADPLVLMWLWRSSPGCGAAPGIGRSVRPTGGDELSLEGVVGVWWLPCGQGLGSCDSGSVHRKCRAEGSSPAARGQTAPGPFQPLLEPSEGGSILF